MWWTETKTIIKVDDKEVGRYGKDLSLEEGTRSKLLVKLEEPVVGQTLELFRGITELGTIPARLGLCEIQIWGKFLS